MFRRFRPSPPLLGSWSALPSALAFSFPLPFQGSPAPGQVCWCGCSSWFLLFFVAFPLLGSLLSNFHFIFIFISPSFPFILILISSSGASVKAPPWRGVCVRTISKDVKPVFLQGVDAWSGSHPPTKTLPFHGDMTKGRLCHVPASQFQNAADVLFKIQRCTHSNFLRDVTSVVGLHG